MMAWRRPIGRANAISSGHWSSGWKSRVMRSMSCFGSTHIQVITIPKKNVGNFVGRELSPLLSNVYLHYVLDIWFQRRMRRRCRGEAYLYRFADDFVAGFQYQTDADDFLESLGKRMEEFHLELAPEKTRHLEFGRYARANAYRKGEKPKEFTFLGMTFFCGKTRQGAFKVKRKTSRKKLRQSLAQFTGWIRRYRN